WLVKAGEPATLEWAFPAKGGSEPKPDKPDKAPEAAAAKGTLELRAEPFVTRLVVDGKSYQLGVNGGKVEVPSGKHKIVFVLEDPSMTKTVKREADVEA